MGRRNKLLKFSEVLSFPNVFENPDATKPGLIGENGTPIVGKGPWSNFYFKNNNPLILELACGKGDYTLGLAERYPGKNFMGVDIKGARIWRGAKTALEKQLPNVAFLRTRIEQIPLFFCSNEVEEIWITFPDPFLKKGKENRRLTSLPFLERYSKILKPGSLIHLKTDDRTLFDFTLDVLNSQSDYKLIYADQDIYSKDLPYEELEIKTFYETRHLSKGSTIKYIRFELVH
jgi:tRNA (guanine-N7-)-methyltransferase